MSQLHFFISQLHMSFSKTFLFLYHHTSNQLLIMFNTNFNIVINLIVTGVGMTPPVDGALVGGLMNRLMVVETSNQHALLLHPLAHLLLHSS